MVPNHVKTLKEKKYVIVLDTVLPHGLKPLKPLQNLHTLFLHCLETEETASMVETGLC
jgi:hypothetical protein